MFLRIFFNKKKYNFLEHLIIYIYATAQMSILNFFITTPLFYINEETTNFISILLSVIFSLIYNTYVLVRLFNLTFIQTILKVLYFIVVGSILYIITSIISGIAMYFYLGPDYFKQFAPVKKKDSIQNVQPIDSTKVIQKNDSILKDKNNQMIIDYKIFNFI